MKRTMLMSIVGAVLLVAVGATSGFAALTGSKHDLTLLGFGITEICEPCHTPHNSIDTPYLWNRSSSIGALTHYDSPNMNGVSRTGVASVKCLSCHDGSTALDAFGGSTGTQSIGSIAGTSANLGGDAESLTNDHPIGFSYSSVAALDAGIRATPTAGAIATRLALDDEVACPTCHEVHNSTGESFMLRQSNAASAVCLTCHNK